MMTIDEMIAEAWLDAAGRYTVDFGGSNLFRVSGLAANDFIQKHPQYSAFEAFIAGAVYQKYKAFAEAINRKREQ